MLEGPQKVAKSRNGSGARSALTSRVAKKSATKGSKKKVKTVARANVVTKGKQSGLPKCETVLKFPSMKGKNLSLQGRAITILSEKEWEQVTDMLNNPPELSPKLVKAIDRYKETAN